MAIEGLQRSDAELLAAVRTGDADAFGALYDRHAVAALTVARQYTDSVADAEDVVADSFTAVYDVLCRGKGPTEAFRAYLFTVVRRVATVHRDYGRRVQATDEVATLEAGAVPLAGADAPALAGFESTVVARAFTTLPERWQLVLWHTEVEGLTPAQVAPLLGLSANSASALAYRAREGLRQAYLAEHLADGLDDRCRPVADKLGAYVRGGLGPRESRKVAQHLDECPRCAALYAELGDVNHGMRAIIAPLVLGLAGLGALDHLLPIGGGLAALGGLPGLTDGGTGAAASTAGSGPVSSPGGRSARAHSAGGASLPVPVVGAVAAAAVALVVVVGVAVYALGGKPGSSGGSDAATRSASTSQSESQTSDPTLPSPDPTPTVSSEVLDSEVDQAGDVPTSRPSSPGSTGPVDQAPPGSRPVVAVDTAGSLLALRAGSSDQELRLAVRNAGDDVAGLVAAVTLPDGVTLVDAPGVDGGGRSLPAASWACLPTSAQAASCTLSRLGAGTTSVLTLRVLVAEDYDGTGGNLAVRFSGAQIDLAAVAVPVTVAPAPARVVVTARAPATLVVDRTRTLTLGVTNVGGTAGQASVVLHVPHGVYLGGPASDGWTCLPRGLTEIACTAVLDRRAKLPLELPLTTWKDVTPKDGVITVTSTPSTGGAAVVPYTVVQAAKLVVTPPDSVLLLQPGVVTDLPLTVTNTGGTGSEQVTVNLTLPPGIALGGAVRGEGWTCNGTWCTRGGLAAGASAVLTVPLTGRSEAVGDVGVTPAAAGADATPVQVPVQVQATAPPASPRVFTGKVRVVQVGAPLLSCSTDPSCPGNLASPKNNNGLPMTPLDTDPPPGARAARPVSSSTTLTYPSRQDVLWAGLYWSANAGPGETWSADRASVQLRGPGGAYQQVSGAVITDVADNAGRQYYQSFADVTAQVQAAGSGTWSLADAAVAATATDPDPSYYAGWALVVVYGTPDAAGPRTVTVHDSGQWIANASAQTVLTVDAVAGRKVTVGAVAWEGDAATTGDRLLLDGTALTPQGGSADNAFDSTATGWRHRNPLGVDAKAFRPVTAAATTATLTASTTSDQYLLGVVTVTVTAER